MPLKLLNNPRYVSRTHSFPTGAFNSWVFLRFCAINQVSSQLSQVHQVNYDSSIDFPVYKIVFFFSSTLHTLVGSSLFKQSLCCSFSGVLKESKIKCMCSICHSRLIHSFSTSKAMLTTLFLVISLLFYTSLLTLCQSSGVQQGAEINLFLQPTMVYFKLSNYLLRINFFTEIELLCLGLACILRLLVEMEKLPSRKVVLIYTQMRVV